MSSKLWNPVLAVDGIGVNNLERGVVENYASQILWINVRFKILYSHKPMHYNGTEIDTNIQYQYLHAHDKMMDVTQ